MRLFAPFIACVLFIGGCFSQHSVQIAPIQVQPIQVTMDVNVNVHESSGADVRAEGDGELGVETRSGEDLTAEPEDDARRARAAR